MHFQKELIQKQRQSEAMLGKRYTICVNGRIMNDPDPKTGG